MFNNAHAGITGSSGKRSRSLHRRCTTRRSGAAAVNVLHNQSSNRPWWGITPFLQRPLFNSNDWNMLVWRKVYLWAKTRQLTVLRSGSKRRHRNGENVVLFASRRSISQTTILEAKVIKPLTAHAASPKGALVKQAAVYHFNTRKNVQTSGAQRIPPTEPLRRPVNTDESKRLPWFPLQL